MGPAAKSKGSDKRGFFHFLRGHARQAPTLPNGQPHSLGDLPSQAPNLPDDDSSHPISSSAEGQSSLVQVTDQAETLDELDEAQRDDDDEVRIAALGADPRPSVHICCPHDGRLLDESMLFDAYPCCLHAGSLQDCLSACIPSDAARASLGS